MSLVTARANGKVIVTGEHSVVYGYPALVAQLNMGLVAKVEELDGSENGEGTNSGGMNSAGGKGQAFSKQAVALFEKKYGSLPIKVQVSFEGWLPIGCGLGSSAAAAHALFQALAEIKKVKISQSEMIDLVQESEKYSHGNPSGIDATAVVRGGVLRFQKVFDEINPSDLSKVKLLSEPVQTPALQEWSWFLLQSGKPSETTKEMVELVSTKPKRSVDEMGAISTAFIEMAQSQNFEPELIRKNHRLLTELGVVGRTAKKMISEIEKVGGVSKITGAGGVKTGSGMILVAHNKPTDFESLAEKNNWKYFAITLGEKI